jgi:hypothetical protein
MVSLISRVDNSNRKTAKRLRTRTSKNLKIYKCNLLSRLLRKIASLLEITRLLIQYSKGVKRDKLKTYKAGKNQVMKKVF